MALIDVMVILETTSGVPENRIVNTWHFDDDDGSTHSTIVDQLEAFYNAVENLYPAYIPASGHVIKGYQVSDPEPRAPIFDETFTFTSAPSGIPLPLETAVVLSYQAAPVSGIPQARRRGRVYLGPISSANLHTDGRISSTAMNLVLDAADSLLTASLASSTWKWSTHSRVLGSGSEVMGGWVDNEWDTQRRRGRDATIRTSF